MTDGDGSAEKARTVAADEKRRGRLAEFERIFASLSGTSSFKMQLVLGLALLLIGLGWAAVEVVVAVVSPR